MHSIKDTTISKRNYMSVMALFGFSSVFEVAIMLFLFWGNPIVDIGILLFVPHLTFMLAFMIWFRRRYPPSRRYD